MVNPKFFGFLTEKVICEEWYVGIPFAKRWDDDGKHIMIAHEMGLLKLGKVSLDGTKIKANASKHHVLSWEHACKIEQQFKDEVEELTRLAEQADADEITEEMNIPDELRRREDRLAAIDEAKAKMEERAAQRFTQEQKEYEEKAASRRAKAEASGKKPRGPEPKPPTPGPRKRDQVNLTLAKNHASCRPRTRDLFRLLMPRPPLTMQR